MLTMSRRTLHPRLQVSMAVQGLVQVQVQVLGQVLVLVLVQALVLKAILVHEARRVSIWTGRGQPGHGMSL